MKKRGKDNPITEQEKQIIKELKDRYSYRQIGSMIKRSYGVVAKVAGGKEYGHTKKAETTNTIFDWADYENSVI